MKPRSRGLVAALAASLTIALPARSADPVTLAIGTLTSGLDGFSGGLTVAHDADGGYGVLAKTTQKWVETTKMFGRLEQDFANVSFQVRSLDATRLAVRLVDATGQSFQQRLDVKPDGAWQTMRITSFDRGESWGGAGDKTWHPPARQIAFVLEQKGTIHLRMIQAVMVPTPVVPDLEIGLCRTGNVFAAGEAVTLPVTTRGSDVAWEVTDFWHVPVASGHEDVADGRCTVQLPSGVNGYFLAHVTARRDGKAVGEAFASYAVVPPYTVRDPATCPFGAMTHFAQGMDPAAILPLLKRLGIVSIRDEHYWSQVEKKPGVYTFSDRSDAYMAACATNGISPLIAMTFGNALYDDKDGPSTPTGFAGYGNYGQAILKHYGGQIRWLEIWNEYNGSWAPPSARKNLESRYATYTAMLKAAYAKIKAIRPDVQVLGCACVLIPLPYIEGIFKNGGLDAMDGVVIHPYRGQPEGVEQEVDELQALIRKYNRGQDKPIWVTETGHHEKTEFAWEAGKGLYEHGRQEGARHLARMYTLLLTRHIQHIYWYLSCDHMNFVTMGLLRRANDPAGVYAVAPAYVTYATLIRQLDGAAFIRREARHGYTRAHVYLFTRDGEEIRTCWATQPAKLRVRARGPLTRVDLVGNTTTLAPKADGIVLDLNEDLFYLKGKVDRVEEVDTGVRILGDAQDDYTKTQGGNNWFYGYSDGTGQGRGDGVEPKGPYTDDDFKEMAQQETMWGVDWAGPVRYLTLSRGSMHPAAANGRNLDAVLRWKSPLAGNIRLVGDATRGEATKGDGVLVRILVNGKAIFEKTVGGGSPATTSFDLPVTVGAGTLVDLVVDPRANTEYDATGYHLRILQDTKP